MSLEWLQPEGGTVGAMSGRSEIKAAPAAGVLVTTRHSVVPGTHREIWFERGYGYNPVSWKGWAVVLLSLAPMLVFGVSLDALKMLIGPGPWREALVASVVATFAWLWWIARRHSVPETPRTIAVAPATLADIPGVIEAMSRSTASPLFAAFVFNTADRPGPKDAVNLQLSVVNARVGFDWILLARRNIQDQERFRRFAQDAGYRPVMRKENGVRFLRVDGGDPGRLLLDVVTRMYGCPQDQSLEMIFEGFDWDGG